MSIDKKVINYYYSFFEVSKELNQKQFYEFNMAIYKVMFFEEHIDNIVFNDSMLTILWKSVKHSLNASIKGYCDKKNIPYDDIFTTLVNPLANNDNRTKRKDNVNEQCIISKGVEEVYLGCIESDKLFVEYLALRKKMKLSNSKTVITRLLNKLEDFEKKGHNNIDVISNAIIGSWKDFYEPKQTNQPKSFKQQENDAIDQSVENYYRMKEQGFDLQEELIKQSQRENQQGKYNELN